MRPPPTGECTRGRPRDGGPVLDRRDRSRRAFLGASAGSIALGLAGCLGSDPDRGTTTRSLGPSTVTTAGDGVEILVAQVAIRDDASGPRVSYRLRNTGDADVTIALRTVLRVEDGATNEATTSVDVPAGDQVTVGYRVATREELGEADAEKVRRGAADFDAFVNGEHRPVA